MENWLDDQEELEVLMEETTSKVNERNRLRQEKENTTELNREIQKNFAEIKKEMARLDSLLTEAFKNPQKEDIPIVELERRKNKIRKVQNQYEVTSNKFNHYNFETQPLLSEPQQIYEETNETKGLDDHQLIDYQKKVMEDQDNDLEAMYHSIKNQQHIAINISEELDVHDKILNDLGKSSDKVEVKLKIHTRRGNKLGKITTKKGLICLIVLLIAFIIFLASTHWGCDYWKC
eukprot:Anaeramoba_ignava/a242964_35.p1 GENE.a242964_35~~a242964_35.p1  ORF type:complete len:233 (-),score=77.06 a242964_35:49-747(-)